MQPIICIEKDYDGYFRSLVEALVLTKTTPFKSKRIIVTSGPYRSYAVQCDLDKDGTLYIDFYSAIRNGFGGLSEADLKAIQDQYL